MSYTQKELTTSARAGNSALEFANLGTVTVPTGSTIALFATVSTQYDSDTPSCTIVVSNNSGIPRASISDVLSNQGYGDGFASPIGNGFFYLYVGPVVTLYARHNTYGGGGRIVTLETTCKSIDVVTDLIQGATWTTTDPGAVLVPVATYLDTLSGVAKFVEQPITASGGIITGDLSLSGLFVSTRGMQQPSVFGAFGMNMTVINGCTSMCYGDVHVEGVYSLIIEQTSTLVIL